MQSRSRQISSLLPKTDSGNKRIILASDDLEGFNLDDFDPEDLEEIYSYIEKVQTKSPLDYIPHPKQKEFHLSEKKIRFVSGGNRSGKTECGAVELAYHVTGIYPEWYPKSKRMDRGVRTRVIVTDFAKGCREVLEPKLWSWIPQSLIVGKPKRSMKGYLEKLEVRHSSGGISTIDILTHEQKDDVFEGWSGDLAWFDEPPPRNKFIATMRGLIDYGGRCFLTLTPISEPWLYDEFIAEEMENVFFISVDIRDNPHISEEEVSQFEKMLTEDEKEARLHGKFRHLVGKVYKEFDPDVHVISESSIKIDTRWPTWFVLDPHDRRPMYGMWFKVDPFNRIYAIAEIEFKGTVRQVAREIIKREVLMGIAPMKVLRQGDPNKFRCPSNVTSLTLTEEFAKNGVFFSDDVDDNITTGHLAVQGLLWYDKTKPISTTNRPKLYFIKETTKICVAAFQRYVWDSYKSSEKAPKETPKDKFKDPPDCVRYMAMSNPFFFVEEMEKDPQDATELGGSSQGFGTGYRDE
ncbi:MAG: terminase family protein [Nanoarchaeota archaeon]